MWFDRVDEAFLPARKRKKTENICFGIEVELEFDGDSYCDFREHNLENENEYFPKNWDIVEDGSLRNGLEFVTVTPKRIPYILNEADALYDYVGEYGAYPSARCSTHIHADVRNFNAAQLFSLMLIWSFYELDFIKKCIAPHRLNNRFCLLDSITPNNMIKKFQLFTNDDFQRELLLDSSERIRYQAMNVLDPLKKQGSVEFRCFEGNMDIDRLRVWLNLINSIMLVAKKFKTKKDMLRLYNMLNNYPKKFKKKFFGCEPESNLNFLALDVATVEVINPLVEEMENENNCTIQKIV